MQPGEVGAGLLRGAREEKPGGSQVPEHLLVCLTSLRITYFIILVLILWCFCVDPQKRKAC